MYQFKRLSVETITPRALVLSLIGSTRAGPRTIGQLILAGTLFGIEPATLRVAVTRLLGEALLESPERGLYQPGPRARAMTDRLRDWQNVESRIVSWDGDWLVALTHALGRSDRRQVRARERALKLSGYRAAEAGLWVRPANLACSLKQHRKDLTEIGADTRLTIIQIRNLAIEPDPGWAGLWQPAEMSACYESAILAMQTSLGQLSSLPIESAARETLLIGQSVIRLINFDPLLPPELGGQEAFRSMVAVMRAYNETGEKVWQDFFDSREKKS